MKYPLTTQNRFVGRRHGSSFAVVDAAGKIIFHVAADDPDAVAFAKLAVKWGNRRRRWFGAPKPRTRADWVIEKNK